MLEHRAEREAVAITGIGVVSPLGSSFAIVADALVAGRSGVREIDAGDPARGARYFAAPVTDIPTPPAVLNGLDVADFQQLDRFERICLAPLAQALAEARFAPGRGPRLGLVLGIGAEQLKAWELDYLSGGGRVFEPRRDRTLVQRLAQRLGVDGPAVTVAAACASSGYAMALGR
ncbi:MAG: hypothetical protein EBR23_13355, partial [Planctomycetia bacterium]|nr:hypothetical protein [Planctomycetia bacterium]